MANLDWSQCPAVESIPGKRSGAWVFRGTRTTVATMFENLQDMGMTNWWRNSGLTREQVYAVLQFVAHTAEAPATGHQCRCSSTTGRREPWPDF